MRILVTGATGVLGRRVLPRLQAEGHEVTAVARSRPDSVRAAVAATGARYVRESIGLLYADGGDRWVDEGHPVAPVANTRTALDAEAAATRVTAAGGTGVVLRFALFYGPDSGHTRDMLRAARVGTAPVLGDPDGFQSHVHLDDAAAAVVAALDAPAGTYNVVEDDPLRHRDLVAVLEDIVDRPLRTPPAILARLGPARALARSVRMSNTTLRSATGWTPRLHSAREGLRDVAAAAQAPTGA